MECHGDGSVMGTGLLTHIQVPDLDSKIISCFLAYFHLSCIK